MKFILSVDQGTTSCRAVLVDVEGNIVAMAQEEILQFYPTPGWVEHDAEEIWNTLKHVIADVQTKAGVRAHDIVAMGITNQRETTVIWDRQSGEPIHPAIVWQDRRTAKFCKKMKDAGHEDLVHKKTGLLLDPYFSATKIHWILDNVPGAREKAEKGELAFGTIDSWLLWNFTGGKVHTTDVTNASRTLLYNIHENKWDDELLSLFSIPESLLPEVKRSSEKFGETSKEIFSIPIPICGIAGDQQAALFGQACTQEGMCKVTYGTGCFILIHTGTKPIISEQRLLTTVACQVDDETEYVLEGGVFIGGAVVQWLRDALGIISSPHEVEELASSVPDSQGVYFVPAFTGLGAPHWDPFVRGAIVGMTRGTGAAHIARAALDGIVYQVTDVIEAMLKDSKMELKAIRVDGGAIENNLLMQMQTNLLQTQLVRPKWKEITALGAAFLAGIEIGFWKDKEEVAKLWKEEKTFNPEISKDQAVEYQGKWKLAVKCATLFENTRNEAMKE